MFSGDTVVVDSTVLNKLRLEIEQGSPRISACTQQPMASLDKLAKMDGWDIGEDDTGGAIGASAAPESARHQLSPGDDAASRPETHTGGDDRPPHDLDGEAHQNFFADPSRPPNEPRQAGGLPVDIKSSASTSRALTGFKLPIQEHLPIAMADGKAISGVGGTASDKLLNTYPAIVRTDPMRRVESATPTPQQQQCNTPKRHPLDTLRQRGFGSDTGSRSGGLIAAGGMSTADEITKFRTSLKRAQDQTARERERREVCEEQARVAYASLEAESKRAFELDNRVRVAEMAMSINTNKKLNNTRGRAFDEDGGRSGVSSKINSWERKSRSLSPVRNGAREADSAEMAGTRAQMAVLADATNVAREEAQSALDTVEGFAKLNRKLVDELRATIGARDDLFEDLNIERGLREQLEEDIGELLENGLMAEFAQKQEELEARCTREQEEAARVVAMHARMEEEYRLALDSAERERARLEDNIASLEGQLLDDRRAQATRAKEDAERAVMGSEEVLSVRAGFHPRGKRHGHGHDRVNLRLSSKNFVANGGNGLGSSGNGWLGTVQDRVERQRNAPSRARAAQHAKSASHGEAKPRTKLANRPHQRSASAFVCTAAGRSTNISSPNRAGGGDGSSIGVGGVYGGGDGSVGHAVQMAAVDSVEAFLGDFVPKLAQPPAVAMLSSAGAAKKGGAEGGQAGVGGVVAKKMSKWSAIGRGGKISARATAVCIEEATKAAEAAAQSRLRSLTNASGRALSASWFSLLNRATTAHADHGHDKHSGNHGGAEGAAASVDSTVPVIAVRRLFQSCGILQATAGGPTLAHADMELQRNSVGKGSRSIGHREFFKVIMALAQYRFASEPKDEALEHLSRMLRPTQAVPGAVPHSQNGQVHVATVEVKSAHWNAATSSDAQANTVSPAAPGGEEELAGAELVLERDRRALEAIFSHYSASSLLPFAALASFCKDFELTPGLISRDDAHRIYAQLAYPNETLLTPKLVAAREGPQGRRSAAAIRNGGGGAGGAPAAGFGLTLGQWMTWLGLAAVGCTWFDKQRGLYNTPTKKVLGLLQWMEGSVGKKRISSKRGTAIIPAFNLLPLKVTPGQR